MGGDASEPVGIGHGMSSGQWERHLNLLRRLDIHNEDGTADQKAGENKEEGVGFVSVGGGSAIGIDPVPSIIAKYTHDDILMRFRERLRLQDLDDCMLMPVLNLSLAEKLHSVEVFANGYKLANIGPKDFQIDHSSIEPIVSKFFATEELVDPWVRIRPSDGTSTFHLRFSSTTPKRLYGHEEPIDTPAPKEV